LPILAIVYHERILRQIAKNWRIECHHLAEAASKRFYEACDRITRALLYRCEWHVNLKMAVPTLIISCPDTDTYWHILSAMAQIGDRLNRVLPDGRIRVYPPLGKGFPYEIGINELPHLE
jgi:hypothetical protein